MITVISFLLGRKESLKEMRLNERLSYALLTIFLFLITHAMALSVLGLKIACSSSEFTKYIMLFIKAKQALVLYFWLITAISWTVSLVVIGRRVTSRFNILMRKYISFKGICSFPFVIAGFVNTIVLSLSPGRVLNCEGSSWRELLFRVVSEFVSYLLTMPAAISTFVTFLSLVWFTYLSYRVYRGVIGAGRKDSLVYSLGFTLLFLGLIISISALLSIMLILPQWLWLASQQPSPLIRTLRVLYTCF